MKIFHTLLMPSASKRLALACLVLMTTLSQAIATTWQNEEKATIRMSLNYYKFAQDSCSVTVKVLTKEDRKYVPVPGVIINLFVNDQTKLGMMGNVTTDEKGQGAFILPDKFYRVFDSLTTIKLIGRLKNDPNYKDKITNLEVKDAFMDVAYLDSLNEVSIQFMEKDSLGNGVPVESVDIKIYVKRLFSLLPVGGDTNFTDENGEVTIQFPSDLPGDSQGNLEVVIKVEENDDYGNIIATGIVPWGSDILVVKDTFDERNMWSSRDKTPYYLLIFPNLILLAVWGVIGYLMVQLAKIYKG